MCIVAQECTHSELEEGLDKDLAKLPQLQQVCRTDPSFIPWARFRLFVALPFVALLARFRDRLRLLLAADLVAFALLQILSSVATFSQPNRMQVS